jgi:signal transduction histidine kinase
VHPSPRRCGLLCTSAGIAKSGILRGEKPSDIKTPPGGFAAPKYDWRELQRWGISESRLPSGSEIFFRELTAWDRYRWQLAAILSALLAQAAIITWLLFERRSRRNVEVESRRRSLEVVHLSGIAEAGALSTSFAHELSQPLMSIMLSAESAERLLGAEPPKVGRVKELLGDIQQADQHASEIISHVKN